MKISYNKEYPTFLFTVNVNEIGQHFREHDVTGKYFNYVSKYFYGAVIRSKKSLHVIDGQTVVMSVRYRQRPGEAATGIKIDLIETNDRRISEYGISPATLPKVRMEVTAGVKQNIILNPEPTLLTAFFYENDNGSSFINFIPQK